MKDYFSCPNCSEKYKAYKSAWRFIKNNNTKVKCCKCGEVFHISEQVKQQILSAYQSVLNKHEKQTRLV